MARPSFRAEGNRWIFTNDQGTWHVWRKPVKFANGAHVGPGYIARMTNHQGRCVLDDTTHQVQTLNDPRSGGLGAFGLCVAQRNEWYPGTPVNYTWDITDRSTTPGFGPISFEERQPPALDAARTAVRYDCSTVLGAFGVPLVRVQRTWQVYARRVDLHVVVQALANPNHWGPWYVKEPKLVAHSLGQPATGSPRYTRVALFSSGGTQLQYADMSKLAHPARHTVQLRHRNRARVQFMTAAKTAEEYFHVVARGWRAYRDGQPPGYGNWVGGPGLDEWAVRSDAREQLQPCEHDEDYCLQYPPDGQGLTRNWEVSRFPYAGRPQTGVMLHGWEGGTGYPDCRCCYRAFGPLNETHRNYLSFSYGPGYRYTGVS